MLFFLTGPVQSGKTRWLQRLVGELGDREIGCAGVIAPGIWHEKPGMPPASPAYEKLGIENVLLPQGERLVFGMRDDLVENRPGSQSARAQLGWSISDETIARVNDHFDMLATATAPASAAGAAADNAESPVPPRLLIVDELGRLELLHDGGLVSAMRLLAGGPSAAFPHALVVVRDYLLDTATERIGDSWRQHTAILPDEAGKAAVLSAFGAQGSRSQSR